jgi:hypothetical protein
VAERQHVVGCGAGSALLVDVDGGIVRCRAAVEHDDRQGALLDDGAPFVIERIAVGDEPVDDRRADDVEGRGRRRCAAGSAPAPPPASSHATATPPSMSGEAGSDSAAGSDFSINPIAPTVPWRSPRPRGSGPA